METPLWISPEVLADPGTQTYEAAQSAAEAASHILWALSGRRYTGVVTTTETYEYSISDATMRQLTAAAFSGQGVQPYLIGGSVVNLTGCRCRSAGHAHLRLRGRPVVSVTAVTVNGGAPLSRADYWIENATVLSIKAPDTTAELCTATVTYTYGAPVPEAGRLAAQQLATELYQASLGRECALPDRVTSVTREGMSFTLLDDQKFLDDLRTGLYQVDLFLRAVNPDRARRPSRVFTADQLQARKVVPGAQLDPLLLNGQ